MDKLDYITFIYRIGELTELAQKTNRKRAIQLGLDCIALLRKSADQKETV